jgi:hypothetical protein
MGVRREAEPPGRSLLTPKLNIVPQLIQQPRVGGGKGVILQLGRRHPFESRTPEWLRLMLLPSAAIKSQVNGLLRVGVGQTLHQLAHGHLDAQLLAQFTRQAGFKGLVRLAFAAGKLPQPAQMRIGVALRDEQFASRKTRAAATSRIGMGVTSVN